MHFLFYDTLLKPKTVFFPRRSLFFEYYLTILTKTHTKLYKINKRIIFHIKTRQKEVERHYLAFKGSLT